MFVMSSFIGQFVIKIFGLANFINRMQNYHGIDKNVCALLKSGFVELTFFTVEFLEPLIWLAFFFYLMFVM